MIARIRLAIDYLIFYIRGCQHPKMEPEGSYLIGVAGEEITLYLESCTVCGICLIHEV
jgi:hypothetical protein